MKPTPLQLKWLNAKAEVAHLWFVQCERFGIDPQSKFVVFPDDNPFAEEYRVAVEAMQAAKLAYDRAQRRNSRSRANRAAERDMLDGLGLKKVRGALGGTYYE